MTDHTAKPTVRRNQDEAMSNNGTAVLETKVDYLIQQSEENKGAIQSLERAVTKLAVIEERQTADRSAIERVFLEIGTLKTSVASLERKAPINEMTSGVVNKVMMVVITAVAGALVGMVVMKPGTPPIVFQQQPAVAMPAPVPPAQPAPSPPAVQ